MPNMYDIKNEQLAGQGAKKIAWAREQMKVLETIRERFSAEKPLQNKRIGACLHVTAETANLMTVLVAGGADVQLCASNPLSTQDDIAAALVKEHGITVYAIHGEDRDTYYRHLQNILDFQPDITMDDGADLVSELHKSRQQQAQKILGSTEETTTGVIRLKSLAQAGKLLFPVVAVNESKTKHLFDNRYGTGQSTIDGILRATNILLAGKIVVVCGYGWCGRGVATRARGMGARVIINEVDPRKALEAVMDGLEVMPLAEAAKIGQIFVTVTGNTTVITKQHFLAFPDGAIIANAGHFDVEIDLKTLQELSVNKTETRPNVISYKMKDGRRIHLLAEGRLVNLAAAEGHPAAVMDLSFANQALGAEYIVKNQGKLQKQVYTLPEDIDQEIARLKLASMNIAIDTLTEQQDKYLHSWEIGT